MIHDVVFPFLSLSAIRKNDDLSLKGNASCQARESLRVLLLSIGVPVKKNWGGGARTHFWPTHPKVSRRVKNESKYRLIVA